MAVILMISTASRAGSWIASLAAAGFETHLADAEMEIDSVAQMHPDLLLYDASQRSVEGRKRDKSPLAGFRSLGLDPPSNCCPIPWRGRA